MANESNTRSAGNTMEIGGGQGHNQGAGAGEFVGGKFTYIKLTTNADMSAASARQPGGALELITQYFAQRATVVVVNASSATLVSVILEANSGWGNAAEHNGGSGVGALGNTEAAACHTTVTAAAISDGLALA